MELKMQYDPLDGLFASARVRVGDCAEGGNCLEWCRKDIDVDWTYIRL